MYVKIQIFNNKCHNNQNWDCGKGLTKKRPKVVLEGLAETKSYTQFLSWTSIHAYFVCLWRKEGENNLIEKNLDSNGKLGFIDGCGGKITECLEQMAEFRPMKSQS